MAQDYTADCFGAGHVAQTDMSNVEDNFAALKSSFSGTSAPSNTVAGMKWFHTTDTVLKMRNNANSDWLGIMSGSSSTKIWIYSNTAGEGWVIDATVTDVILSIKGGSQAYNANGGTQAGTWTQPSHTLIEAELPEHTHGITGFSHTHGNPCYAGGSVGSILSGAAGAYKRSDDSLTYPDNTNTPSTTPTIDNTGSDTAHNHGTTYRPAAAIGTLQYLDV